ncbi:MAG: hypothetical protein AB8G11_22310 [Saprospiraceae bacterium]
MKHLMLLPLLLIIFSSLNAQYIPPHRDGVSQADYDKWVRRIKAYYKHLNNPDEALTPKQEFVILANYSTAYYVLKEPTDSCYQFMEQAMEINKEFGCSHLNNDIESSDFLGIPSFKEKLGVENWEYLMQGCDKILAEKTAEKALALEKEYEENKDIYNFELIEQLKEISKKDQDVRYKWSKIKQKYGKDSKEELDYIKIVHESDSINLVAVEAIIEKHGYPGKNLVGSEYQTDAMWVIHHAKYNEFRKKYFPILYQAAENGELPLSAFKLYIDRLHQVEFGTQLYGTQSQYNKELNAYERTPMEDEENYKQRIQDFNNGIIDIGRLSL